MELSSIVYCWISNKHQLFLNRKAIAHNSFEVYSYWNIYHKHFLKWRSKVIIFSIMARFEILCTSLDAWSERINFELIFWLLLSFLPHHLLRKFVITSLVDIALGSNFWNHFVHTIIIHYLLNTLFSSILLPINVQC